MSKKRKEELLNLGHPIFETHCHLDYLKRFKTAETLKKCCQVGVEKILTIGVSLNHQDRLIELSEEFSNIYCSQGIHPHNANDFNKEIKEKILNNIKHPKVIALGEIGLDYHYDYAPREKQIEVFETQLEIAIQADLPIVIHTREADSDCLSILKNSQSKIKNIVLHSYTSGVELAEYALSQDYFIGFNGIITFKNAQNVRDILSIVPITNLVVETDAPFLSPTPHRGIENGPQLIPFVAQKIAIEKNIDIKILLKQMWENSHKLFNLTLT